MSIKIKRFGHLSLIKADEMEIKEDAKIIFKADCAGRTFSILRYKAKEGVKYSVGETGVEMLFTFTSLERAYDILMQRMHLRYSLVEVEQRLKEVSRNEQK